MDSLSLTASISKTGSGDLSRPSIAAAATLKASTTTKPAAAATAAKSSSAESAASRVGARAIRKSAALRRARSAAERTAWTAELAHVWARISLCILRHAWTQTALNQECLIAGIAGVRCKALGFVAAQRRLKLLVEALVS